MTESERGGGSEGVRSRLYAQLMFADSDYRVCEVIVARLLALWVFNAIDDGGCLVGKFEWRRQPQPSRSVVEVVAQWM